MLFENNLNKGTYVRFIWYASKVFMKGYFIPHNNELKRQRQQKTQVILGEIKRKEEKLKKFPERIIISQPIEEVSREDNYFSTN